MVIVPILLTGAILGGLYATRGPVTTLYRGTSYFLRLPQRSDLVMSRPELEAELNESRPVLEQLGFSNTRVGTVTPQYADLRFQWNGRDAFDTSVFRNTATPGLNGEIYQVFW